MRADAALEQRVAADRQVMRGDRCRDVGWRGADELHRVIGGDVFEHQLERGKVGQQRAQYALDEYRFAVEDIDIGVGDLAVHQQRHAEGRSEEHTSELQSLMRISSAVSCLKKKIQQISSKNMTNRT